VKKGPKGCNERKMNLQGFIKVRKGSENKVNASMKENQLRSKKIKWCYKRAVERKWTQRKKMN
jgi:hypothetical protein